jgi:hypothetical protein
MSLSNNNLLLAPPVVQKLIQSKSPEPHNEPSPSEDNSLEVVSAIPNPEPLEATQTIPAWQIQFLPEFRRTHPEHRCIW